MALRQRRARRALRVVCGAPPREETRGLYLTPLERSIDGRLRYLLKMILLFTALFIRSGLTYEHDVRIGSMSNLCALLNNMVT